LETDRIRLRLDCGSGSVHAMARFDLPWDEVTHQFITHYHVDHLGELPALLFALKWLPKPRSTPLTLIGPVGFRAKVDGLVQVFGEELIDQHFPVIVQEMAPGETFDLGHDASLRVAKTVHRPESLAVRVRLGGVDVGYTGDTAYTEELCELFSGVDALITECSFPEGTYGSDHLDARAAATMAQRAGAGRLIVVHCFFEPGAYALERRLTSIYDGPVLIAEDGATVPLVPKESPEAPREPPGGERESFILHRDPEAEYPLVSWGAGARLGDGSGGSYLDASGGAAVSSLGHDRWEVRESIVRRVRQVPYAHTGFFSSQPAEELAEVLVRRSPPGLDRVVFSSSGSESVEVALKLARQYFVARGEPDRTVFIARRHAYHGSTLGALSVSSVRRRTEPFEGLFPRHEFIGPCYAYRHQRPDESPAEYGRRAASELQAAIDKVGRERVIGFIAETVSGASLGAVPPAPEYFTTIREICDRNDILLILDEVMCGAYRTGYFGAFEPEGVVPDLFSIAKGLAAGYQPLGATVVSRAVHSRITETDAFRHSGTFVGHPTACSAGLATQRLIEERGLPAEIRVLGERLLGLLAERCADLSTVGDVRGRGLLVGVELVRDRRTREPLSRGEVALRVRNRAMEEGVLVYPGGGAAPEGTGDHVLLAPSFLATEEDLEQMVDRLVRAIEQVSVEWLGSNGRTRA
jgi:hypothetical protein